MESPQDTHAGQAVYTPFLLRLYNVVVLALSNRFAWKCPTKRQLAHYNQHISACHLDVGVGSGYYLYRCKFPVENPDITLMDANQNCLQYCQKLLARYQPTTIQADIYDIPTLDARFASIGLNYVLHCLPGNFETKSKAIAQLLPLLQAEGVLFGTTILKTGAQPNCMARKLLNVYNQKGIFGNQQDDVVGLENLLKHYFHEVSVETMGLVAIFAARRKK